MWKSSCTVQRDKTHYLDTFERSAFRMKCKIFVAPLHTFATLDDDLYGIRTRDNLVKSVRSRMADREVHRSDAVADAFFRITFIIRFCRRGDMQAENALNIFKNLFVGLREQSVHGLVITAYRSYGSMSLISNLLLWSIGTILIMPEHLVGRHSFDERSFLSMGR